uniref:Uncharacterized protein n=1 Tax=Rhizophora mucronata TaxID=61149 RepID=A0A2P2KH26_RHIMU
MSRNQLIFSINGLEPCFFQH